MKRLRFWGTRGSLPVALTAAGVRDKLIRALRAASGRAFASDEDLNAYVDGLDSPVSGTYGGHTSCLEIETGGTEYVLCDLGTGVRPFGQKAMARHGAGAPQTYHIFMSHVHWDHIMGFPFFTPAYIPGNRIFIYGGHAVLEEAFRRQQSPPSFPVDFSALRANIEFVRLEVGQSYDIAGVAWTSCCSDTPATRMAIASRQRAVPSSTPPIPSTRSTTSKTPARYVAFFRDADIVVFDAMYSLADAISVKADWGHSSNIVGVELCQMAGARHCACFTTNPSTATMPLRESWRKRGATKRSPVPARRCS